MAPRLVVLGWDSASFDVIDPLMTEGRLPVLAELTRRGFRSPLHSTWPPMTDSAWTSAFTGVNPGAHGIFGSWYRAPGAYACRYFSSRDRRAAAVWELAGGLRWAVVGVPMTYPPTPVNGAMAATYGAPPGSRFSEPPALHEELAARWDVDDLKDRAPHGSLERFLADLLRGARVQSEAFVWLAERVRADCAMVVWPQVDRAQHFFWRFRNREHALADAVERAYEELDAATGRVLEAWPDADVMIVSDHGAGPLFGDVNVGAFLARTGRAVYGRERRTLLPRLAWAMPPAARKLGRRLAPGVARATFGATLSGQLGAFDWTRSEAFVGFHGDLWLNLQGREPQGTVSPSRADELVRAIADDLLGIADPRTGARVFAEVRTKAATYRGPQVDLAPDAVLDAWSAGYRVAPRRGPSAETILEPEPLAGVGEAWSSDHRPLGIFVAAGPRLARGAGEAMSLMDVCPTMLALLESPIPAGLDGRVATEALDAGWLERHPVTTSREAGARAALGEYSGDEAAAVAAHLRDLGYIE